MVELDSPRLGDALASVAAFAPEEFDRFRFRLDAGWIEDALLATGTATVRRRRLPAALETFCALMPHPVHSLPGL